MITTPLEYLGFHGWTAWIFPQPSAPDSSTPVDRDHHCLEVCQHLLREELTALETYDEALARFSNTPEAWLLNRIREDHHEAVTRLQCNLCLMGGQPDTVREAARPLAPKRVAATRPAGKRSAICRIEQCERRAQEAYEEALRDKEVMEGLRETIRRELLPKIERNLGALDQVVHGDGARQ